MVKKTRLDNKKEKKLMKNEKIFQNGGGASPLSRFTKGFGGIGLVKILR